MTHWHIVDNESGVFFLFLGEQWTERLHSFCFLSFEISKCLPLVAQKANRKKSVWMPVWILIHFTGGQYRFKLKSTFVDRIWTNIYTFCSDQWPVPLLLFMFGMYLHFCLSYQFLMVRGIWYAYASLHLSHKTVPQTV